MISDADRNVLLSWAMREIVPWQLDRVRRAGAEEVYAHLNDTETSFIVFQIADGDVWVRPKPGAVERETAVEYRKRFYLRFFREVAKLLPAGFTTAICVCLYDEVVGGGGHAAPIFGFQKRRFERSVLLPDIDFLEAEFYEDGKFLDVIPYEEKLNEAVFTGSTTGGWITAPVARTLALPRLRAAGFFAGNPKVDFRLPVVLQFDSKETEALLRDRSFCQLPRLTWQEQFRKRFLNSMDGNGATCSRVAVALLSNCVLAKYESDFILYYFAGLQEWLHYVPVSQDDDIEKIIDGQVGTGALFRQIAAAGREFATKFLSRSAVQAYTAELLQLYEASFIDSEGKVGKPSGSAAATGLPVARLPDVVAHIEGQGDTPADADGWTGKRRSGRAIEGFALSIPDGVACDGLNYRAVLEGGELSVAVRAGEFCGTRGLNQPIFGLSVETDDAFSELFDVTCEAYFVDGTKVGPVLAPAVCRAGRAAALEAFRVRLWPIPKRTG